MTYAIQILQIKLWEWEGIKEKWDVEITKNGPSEDVCNYYNLAVERISELKKAIEDLEFGKRTRDAQERLYGILKPKHQNI